MKKVGFLIIFSLCLINLSAQTITYRTLKDLVTSDGDTVELPQKIKVEKRNKKQIMLTNGADYKLESNKKWMNKNIKSRFYAVKIDNQLYVNCKKLKIKKFRFGKFYAPAMWVNNRLFFSAAPIGPAAASVGASKNIGMGALGDAINNSSLIFERVFYEIDTETGTIEFVGKNKMEALLINHPDLKEEYLQANNEEAQVTRKFLLELKKRTE